MTLQDLKAYLRVDGDDEDALIEGFKAAAVQYLSQAGVSVSNGGLYDVVVKMLVAISYEHRDTAEKEINIPPIINNFITQLALATEG